MSYRAIMFDLDGTLADTLADIAGSANHALAQLRQPTRPVAEYRYLAGQGLEWLMTQALGPEYREMVPRGMKLFREYYAVHGEDHTAPYPGIAELLDELTTRGTTMAVLSNKPDPETQAMIARVFGRWKFVAIVGHRPGWPLKPDPASAIAIMSSLNIEPNQWLYLGDTRVDMLTASAAGMFSVGVTWGFREEAELRESGAKAIIRKPGEVLGLLGRGRR